MNNNQFDYDEEINPLVEDLCKLDNLNDNASRGQVQEFVKSFAILKKLKPEYENAMSRYSEAIEANDLNEATTLLKL